jgi:hypothetical protein
VSLARLRTAGTVGSMLYFAKASKASRLDEAQQAVDKARGLGVPAPTLMQY